MSFGQLKPIIGGSQVLPHEYPFAVYLSIETQPSWHAVCGGTLVSDRHIITAGHCLIHAPSTQSVKIGYGHTHVKQQEHARAYRLLIHPHFNPRTLFNDIAIIELATPIRQTINAHRIPIYFGPVDPGQVLTTMGWGITSNAPGARTVAVMNRVDLSVASPDRCKAVDASFVSSNGPFICTGTQPGDRDECSGDSGSPAIVTLKDGGGGSPMGPRELREMRQRELLAQANVSSNDSSSSRWSRLIGAGGGLRHSKWRQQQQQQQQQQLLRLQLRDVRLVALTSYGDNTHHDVHPPCGDPSGFGFSTHIAHYTDFIVNATGLTRAELEAPLRLDRLRDYDNVKSKLKGLWSQYSSGGNAAPTTTTTTGRDVSSSSPAATANNTQSSELLEEMLLFPTYAYRDERLKVWRVQVRGWGFCRNPNTRRVRLAASLMRRFIRIPPGGEPDQLLLDRVSYLFAGQPTSSDMVKVAMAGIAEPMPFELHVKQSHIHHPPPPPTNAAKPPALSSNNTSLSSSSSRPVNLLDAPIVLTTHFDPSGAIAQDTYTKPSSSSSTTSSSRHPHHHHAHDRVVRNAFVGVEPTIIQKALQIDAFSWQNLVLDEGLFQGEILLGFNELEWLTLSYDASARADADGSSSSGGGRSRRLIELRGKLFGWPEAQIVGGLAHLVEPRGVSVVSDIDDTIKASNITAEKRIVLETVFARPMQAVPGMSELYREWYTLGCEFHYVSNSPWQLYPSLDDFFHRYKFPPGSAHLRSFDPNDLLSIKNYTGTPQLKSDTIETLFQMFPHRKFVFVGDCGEHDLETYTELARRFPGRVLRIYIRDVFAPMSVAAVTTDTAAAGNTISQGIIPYGIVRPSKSRQQQQQQLVATESESDYEADLISLQLSANDDDDDDDDDLATSAKQQGPPPPVPPKPSHLRKPSTGRCSSPLRNATTPLAASSKPPPPPPPKPPRRINSGTGGGEFSQQKMPGTFVAAPTMPQEPLPTSTASSPGMMGGDRVSTAERFEARVTQLREQAQEWLAFYAQQFYVAPTQSFLRYSHIFMPTVEQNMHIIDYEAVANNAAAAAAAAASAGREGEQPFTENSSGPPPQPPLVEFSQHRQNSSSHHFPDQRRFDSELPHVLSAPAMTMDRLQQQQPLDRPGSFAGHKRAPSFGAYNIPEPPPPEAQLARTSRRLQLWKRYQLATQGLAPDLCRLFVDASDIKQDHELFELLIPQG